MPPILEIGVALTVIFGAVLGAAFALWKWVDSKVKALEDSTDKKIEKVDLKIDNLEKNTVSKDDHHASMGAINKSIDSIALALRETGATLTSRIDLVLFEVGRQKSGTK